MFNKILVVCVGNICRSPYAEKVLKNTFPYKQVSSAGIAVHKSGLTDAPWYHTGESVAQNRGYDTSHHKATQLTQDMCRDSDLILVMEHKHIEMVTSINSSSRGKIIPLGHWLGKEIPDPHRQAPEAFEFCYELIDDAVKSLEDKI